jgi:2-polyprenyl-3-methyl-5-hydroxy-6-metoxy-1,4-benzoquinol methylase
MKKAETDARDSISATEFLWREQGLSQAHSYLIPGLTKVLAASQARKVLDFGCGNGALTVELGRMGYEVVGVDNSESGIRIAVNAYPSTQFFRAAVDEPLPRDLATCFDAMIAVEVIEHLLLPRMLFTRAREALKKHGQLIITTPYHGYIKNLAIAIAGGFDNHWHPLRDYGHVKFFSKRTLCRLFEEQGFGVEQVVMVGRVPAVAKSIIVRGRLR